MCDRFEITFSWLAGEHGELVDRATLAEIGILVDGLVATELEDLAAKTVRMAARLSGFRLASWLAANWWRLRWEPERRTQSWRMAHSVGAAGGGYAWPDLTLTSDGVFVHVASRSTRGECGEPIRYLGEFDAVVHANVFEQGVDRFVDAVVGRLMDTGINEPGLKDLWDEVREERSDPNRAAWRRLEAMSGFDPGEAPDRLIAGLQERMSAFGSGAVEELAGSSGAAALTELDRFAEAGRSPDLIRMTIADVETVRDRIRDALTPLDLPWRRAERAATLARQVWSLAPEPLSTAKLAELCSLPASFVETAQNEPDVPMPAGFREPAQRNEAEVGVALAKRHPMARRFALARIVADHLVSDQSERLLPATPAKTARQKFQRAFAQELLCPSEALLTYLCDAWPSDATSDEAIEDAATFFEVSPLMVRTKLVNIGILPRDVLSY